MNDHEDQIDRLYGLPLEEFTAARDELARSLRADGLRADADGVKRLRKPNLVAWAFNQVRREDPKRVDELLAAGERLQDAQRQLVGGGERGLLRSAAADERRLVEELVALGERHLSGAGHPIGSTLQSKLWATAHAAAAAAGAEARERLRAGRLVHDYEISDLGLPSAAAPVEPVPASAPPRRSSTDAGAERKRQAARSRLERARGQLTEHQTTLEGAKRQVADARREAARAASALTRAEAQADRAQGRLGETEARVAELERELRALSEAT